MKRIVLTGGGTAGHVTPNIALIPTLKHLGYEISYIGSYDGIEKQLIENITIPYHGVATGKLRRYFSMKTLKMPFDVIKGTKEAKKILSEIKPDVIFSKGGFVSVPVVNAANKLGIPTILHESDMTPGLANKMCIKSCTKICCNFPETLNYLPSGKAVLTGSPIRSELLQGEPEKARTLAGFTKDLPVILVMGGSLGAAYVNEAVRKIMPKLLASFNVIHLCGKGKLDDTLTTIEGYKQFEYISDELPDIFALSDMIISRAGANAIFEIHALAKPNILIPLSAEASRGDQILNARSFEKSGFSKVLQESDISDETLLAAIDDVWNNKEKYIGAMKSGSQSDGVAAVIKVIEEVTK